MLKINLIFHRRTTKHSYLLQLGGNKLIFTVIFNSLDEATKDTEKNGHVPKTMVFADLFAVWRRSPFESLEVKFLAIQTRPAFPQKIKMIHGYSCEKRLSHSLPKFMKVYSAKILKM